MAHVHAAMRTAGVLSYLLTDHLGSTAVTTDAAGVKAGELRYLPFGATRTTWGVIPTDRRFTGQPRYATLGLDYFGARWYDPALGRFAQADTIVPEPGDPQSLDRYSYARNNPLRYTDPSGHDIQDFLDTFSEVAGGLVAQVAYVNSLQAVSALATQPNESDAATFGRHLGNVVALAQSVEEMVGGVGLIGGGAAACGTGVLCLAGASAVVAGSAVAAHGVGMAGIAAAQEGQMLSNLVMASTQKHHIATNKNWVRDLQWTKSFKELFDKGGLDLDDAINKVDLPGHTGPHSQGYHQWVYDRLRTSIRDLKTKDEIRAALESELNAIRKAILADPSLLSQ